MNKYTFDKPEFTIEFEISEVSGIPLLRAHTFAIKNSSQKTVKIGCSSTFKDNSEISEVASALTIAILNKVFSNTEAILPTSNESN